jgi:hypothetical protein
MRLFGPRVEVTIAGIQRLQTANLRAMYQLRPENALGRAVRWATIAMHRYVVRITHVDTSALKRSHRMSYRESDRGAEGLIDINPNTRNPKHGIAPRKYGPVEHARGGSHAFYERAYYEAGPEVLRRAGTILARSLPR